MAITVITTAMVTKMIAIVDDLLDMINTSLNIFAIINKHQIVFDPVQNRYIINVVLIDHSFSF